MATIVPNNAFDTQPKEASNTGIVGGAIRNVATGQNTASKNLDQYNPMSDMSAQTYTAQTREVDPTKETAAGQVTSLLANDNPLMQRARTLATQGMAQRGLVNSSMSQGAGVAAMVDRITPIAQQDAQTYSNRSLANMEATNTAGQFNVGQNNQLFSQGVDIASRFGLQKDQQTFATGEREAGQTFQTSERVGTQQFQSLEAIKQREFTSAENGLDRAQQMRIATLQEGGMDRRQAENIAASERQQAAAQAFQRAEARATQEFQVQQAAAERESAKALENLRASNNADAIKLADQLANANVPKDFASKVALNTNNAINQALTDPNLTPEAKKGAVQNIVDASNSTLQWGSTMYNTPLPGSAAPSATASTLNPGGSYQAASESAKPTAMPANFSELWSTAHDATGDFSTVAPYIKGKTIEQVMKDTGANRRDAIYILQKVGG
jgi:hypothetical protein